MWFEDECHFQQHGTRCAMWVPPEERDPIVLHAPTRKNIAIMGAVREADGRLLAAQADRFNTESFHAFLVGLVRLHRAGRKIVLVLDNARWHHARKLRAWLHEHRRILTLLFLPPYSPDLNPIERVWKLTRRLCTHNRYFPDLAELQSVLFEQLAAWTQPNDTLRRLCAIT